jgi:hypothetical protein
LSIRKWTIRAAAVSLIAGLCGFGQSPDPTIEPGRDQLPSWMRRGKLRFARLDGGPLEAQKAKRSRWGRFFTPQDDEVLSDLYSKYAERMAGMLNRAHITAVWVTFSPGFSAKDEADQHAAARHIAEVLHAHGIKVAAYLCPLSMFWQSLFQEEPQDVSEVLLDPNGVPYRYSGNRDPLRFIGDLRNPDWVKHQEKTIGEIIDDGFDAIFLDNTGNPTWASEDTLQSFFITIRRYIHDERKSNILLFTNLGIFPTRARLNRYMDFTFDEFWGEPGVWDDQWNASNVRRDRLMRGILPGWKPLISEYSRFHNGNRSTSFLRSGSAKLSIAEAASFSTAYTWDMEGPFDTALMEGRPAAMQSWSAISRFNGFLAGHESLYAGARNLKPLLVVIPHDYEVGFYWKSDPTGFFDLLSKNSVLYDIRSEDVLTAGDLTGHTATVVPFWNSLSSEHQAMIEQYRKDGGSVYRMDAKYDPAAAALTSAQQDEVLKNIATAGAGSTTVKTDEGRHVLANVTTLDGGGLAIHLLNYNPDPVSDVRVELRLGKRFEKLAGATPEILSPDQDSARIAHVKWRNGALEARLPHLDTYAVLVLKNHD